MSDWKSMQGGELRSQGADWGARDFRISFRGDTPGLFCQTSKRRAHRAKYGSIKQESSQNQGVGSDISWGHTDNWKLGHRTKTRRREPTGSWLHFKFVVFIRNHLLSLFVIVCSLAPVSQLCQVLTRLTESKKRTRGRTRGSDLQPTVDIGL